MGRLAQLVERHVYTVDVGSSRLSPPTILVLGGVHAPRHRCFHNQFVFVTVRVGRRRCRPHGPGRHGPAPYGPGRRGRDAGSALRPSCHRSFRRLRSGRMEPSIQQGRLLPGAVPLHQGARGPSARAALRALAVAMANVAGKKPDAAKPLLKELIAKDNASAMLVLAYISPEAEAAKLMEKAADTGNANAMMLYGMTLMTGKGVPKDTLAGVRLVRRAADAGSTRAMLLMANFYNQGVHGVGLDHGEATDLIIEAAHLGDPSAKALLINLQRGGTSGTTPQ